MGVKSWLLKKIKGIDKKRLNDHLDIICKNSGKSRLYVKFDIFKNFLTRGTGYTDYFRGNYIDLTKEEKDTFVTAKKFYQIIHYLNNPMYKGILNDKLIFNEYFKEYLKRDFINLRTSSYEEFDNFLKNKNVVFAKIPNGECGIGISKINLKENKDHKKLYNELIENNQLLVEDAIIQCEELNKINPNVVNSFRIITLYKDGEVYLIGNALRVNKDNSDVIGHTDDLYFSFNEKGVIDSNVIDDYGNVYEEHPLTKMKFKDVKVPYVKEAFDMCKKAALKLPEIRYIGWDIAFSENGPVMVEGNEYPGYGIIQFYKLKDKRTGHLKEISDILGDEMKKIKL